MLKFMPFSGLILTLSSPVALAQIPALPIPVPAPPPNFPELTTPTPTSNPVSEEYILGPGDRLQMDIFNVPEYSGENGKHQVQLDGSLNLPLVGQLKVQGLTLGKTTEAIKKLYAEYLQRPLITLNLIAPRPLQIAIAGEVFRPGAYTIAPTGGTPGTIGQVGIQLPTVTQALKVAGGITPSADVRQVKIRRRYSNSEQIVNVNLWELLQSGDLRQDLTLRDGDTIYIPTITDLNMTEASQLSFASFAGDSKQPINVAVVGEVNRPGTYTLTLDVNIPNIPNPDPGQPNDMNNSGDNINGNTVTSAIKKAGGITEVADIRNIKVKRLTRAGTEQNINVDLRKLLYEGDLSQDVKLQPGDTVIIPQASNLNEPPENDIANASFSPDTVKVTVVGEVYRPGTMGLPPKTTLNQAILATGGFVKARAETDAVELIRINRNGTVTKRRIKVNLTAPENEDTNPVLKNNDVITIGRNGRATFSDTVGNTLAPLGPLNNFFGVFRIFNSLF